MRTRLKVLIRQHACVSCIYNFWPAVQVRGWTPLVRRQHMISVELVAVLNRALREYHREVLHCPQEGDKDVGVVDINSAGLSPDGRMWVDVEAQASDTVDHFMSSHVQRHAALSLKVSKLCIVGQSTPGPLPSKETEEGCGGKLRRV